MGAQPPPHFVFNEIHRPHIHTAIWQSGLHAHQWCVMCHCSITELAIFTALSWQPLAQTGIKASPLEMGAVQGERTVFSTHLCIGGGQQWPTQSQPRHLKQNSEMVMLSAPFGCTHPPPPIPAFC